MSAEEELSEEQAEETEESSDEENVESLEEILKLPDGYLAELAVNEGLELFITKVKDYVENKESEIEDYQATVKEFEENLEERDNDISELVQEPLQATTGMSEVEHTQIEQSIVTLQTENVATKEKCASLEEQLEILKRELENTNETLTETNEEFESIRQESHDHQVTIEEMEEEFRQTKKELESSRCPPDVPGADRNELLRILDRRQTEINRLTEDWRVLSEKLEETSCAKFETQSRLDELTAQETSLSLKGQMFERDKQLMQQQNNWLSTELDNKSTLLLSTKKDLSIITTNKETSLSVKQQEIEHLKESLANQKSLVEDLQSRLDSSNRKVLDQREEHVEVEQQLRRELSSQCKLTALYQSASEEGESMMKELMNKINQLQTSLTNVTLTRDDLSQSLAQLQEQYSEMESTNTNKIESLEAELRNANDLLKLHSEVLPLATTETGLSLTQIYSKYVESSRKLRDEKEETARLNNYLTQIMQELEEKTPVLQKLRRDHDVFVRANQELQNKMEMIAEDSETLRVEAEESLKFSRVVERENKRLKVLTGDLGRQVKTLLQECEEARGGVASTSHVLSCDTGDEVSSSSQVISSHLVEFRSIAELQEQNQKLLAVVRELGEEREKEEKQEESCALKEMRTSLDDAMKELKTLRSNRERQKEMVEAIVKQRDMYRILLAQTTPLPQDDNSQAHVSRDSGTVVLTPQKSSQIDKEAFAELKEQFEAYRREKLENDRILQEQMDGYRNEASTTRLDNAKLASKLEYANERYQMLDSAYKGLKKELTALNNKENHLMSLLTKHQVTIDTLNTELFSSKDDLSRLEVERQSLKIERDSLYDSEKRSRVLYEQMSREKQGQNVLLTNLQTIRNNMERNEFELKQRLNLRIEGLEKENVLLKEQNHGYEDRRTQMREAYEKQVSELTSRLDETTRAKTDKENVLKDIQLQLKELQDELEIKTNSLTTTTNELQEKKDRLLAMEEDAGVEFKSKIRLLERQLADAKAKVTRLTEEVGVSREDCEEYRKLSEKNEQALRELNQTCDDFKLQMNTDIERLQDQETTLTTERDSEREQRIREVTSLKEELLETQEALSQTQDRIETLQSQLDIAEAAMESSKVEVSVANQEAKRFSDMNIDSQELYQRELVQHGKTMEELAVVKEEIETKKKEILQFNNTKDKLQAELDTISATRDEKESVLITERDSLRERCEQITRQNELSHSEIQQMSARIVTLTQSDYVISSSPSAQQHDDNSSNLLEIVRFVKREKEIATTKQEMAESECFQLKHKSQKLEKELNDCQAQLKEITETAKLYEQSTVEYKEVMAKVQTLNVLSDSNTLLRDEKDRLKAKLQGLEDQVKEYESQLLSSKESQRRLAVQKDSLLAEKAALRNEVERWNKRTSQLIEQYNKIDPEEYKQLLEEKDIREAENEKLSADLLKVKEDLELEKKTSQEERDELTSQIQELRQQTEIKGIELSQLTNEGKTVKEDLAEKNRINAKLRELGRKYRALYEEKKREFEDMQSQKETSDKQLEELKEANSRAPTEDASEELRQQAETTKLELETVRLKLADKEDKFNKVVKTAKSLKAKFESAKIEKEDLSKELQDVKNMQNSLSNQMETLKTEYESHAATIEENIRREYTTYTRELEEKIERLEEDLKTKKRSRVVQPQVAESTSTTATLPSAAVRPTVTTTPTASIRPMPLQITTAPTAHVTPTQVSTSVPSTVEATATQSSNSQLASATVFVRSTSPLVQPGPSRSQMMPSTSSSGEADNSRPSIKRSRDEANEYPPSKRCNVPAVQTAIEMEPSTTTNDNDSSLLMHVESSDDVSPDTQTEQDRPIADQSPPQSVGEADLPATIPADTTSDEATEPVEETGLTSSQVYEIHDDNEVVVIESEEVLVVEESQLVRQEEEGDEIVIMATEPLESANTEDSAQVQQEEDEEEQEEQEMEEEEYTPEPGETGSEEEVMEEEEEEEEEEELSEERSPQLPQTAATIAEESVGLPDDEVTVDLPAPQQVTIASTTVRQLPNQSHRLRLQMGDSRAHTPGVIDSVIDDHQVPCTPVLAEDKQLGKNPPAQSVPAESNDNSNTTSQQQPMERLSVPPAPPSPSSSSQDKDGGTLDEVMSSLDRPSEERSRIGEDGDIHEEVIDEIIGVDSSSDEEDVEEGQLPESPKQSSHDFQPPTSVSMTTTTSSVDYIPPVSITSTMTDDGTNNGGEGTSTGVMVTSETRLRVRPRPIIWDQPSNSGQSSNEPKKVPKSTALRRPSKGIHRGRSRGRGSRGKQQ